MPDPIGWVVLFVGALVGSVVGGVAGFGAGIIVLPLVSWAVGIRSAVPVLTVTMSIGNLSRIWWSRGEVDRVGVFLIASVPIRRLLATDLFRMRLHHFPLLGAFIGLLSALVVTTGPLNTPFFLAYGLRRSAFVGTDAVCAMAMHLARGAALARYALLTWDTVVVGTVLGGTMVAGAWLGRHMLDHMSDRVFLGIIEALLVAMGLHVLLFPRENRAPWTSSPARQRRSPTRSAPIR